MAEQNRERLGPVSQSSLRDPTQASLVFLYFAIIAVFTIVPRFATTEFCDFHRFVLKRKLNSVSRNFDLKLYVRSLDLE